MTAADHAATALEAIEGVFKMYGVNLTPVNMLKAALDAHVAQAEGAFTLEEMQQVRQAQKDAEARLAQTEDALRLYIAEHNKTIGVECWCPLCKQARAALTKDTP